MLPICHVFRCRGRKDIVMPSHCKAVVVLLWCCVYGTMITEGEEPSVCPGEAEGDCPEKVAFWAEN